MGVDIDELLGRVSALRLREHCGPTTVAGITHDSREVGPGDCFVALRGAQVDGHRYIDRALAAGATSLVVSSDHEGHHGVTTLEADEPRRWLGAMGAAVYGDPSKELWVVAITGTNGKTSTSFLLEAIASGTAEACGVIGTTGYRWPGGFEKGVNTTPDGLTLQRVLRRMVDGGVTQVFMEVSSHALALGRVAAVDFDTAVFTNLSQDHLGFHGTMCDYRQSKWSLFRDYLPGDEGEESRTAVINTDGQEGQRLAQHLEERGQLHVIKVGTEGGGGVGQLDYRAVDIDQTVEGTRFVIEERDGRRWDVALPIPGRFNVENALVAAAAMRQRGVDAETVGQGLSGVDRLPGRMEVVGCDAPADVFVDYAHTPDALKQALAALRPVTRGRLWVVFGCGGDRDQSKRPVMGKVAQTMADRVIVTTDNPRSEDPKAILDDIEEGVDDRDKRVWWRIPDRRAAIGQAVKEAVAGDVVLIAGKGHETTQESAGQVVKFDDREVVREAAGARGEAG